MLLNQQQMWVDGDLWMNGVEENSLADYFTEWDIMGRSYVVQPPQHDIFKAVRLGEMERVKFLVEEERVDLNCHDTWDTTPLYHAAFTGNQEMVSYLLDHGAQCAEKTFDGERCLYGALNENVRRQLREAGFQRAGASGHDPYLHYITTLCDNEDAFPDLHLTLAGHRIQVQQFFINARCPSLGQTLEALQSGTVDSEQWGDRQGTERVLLELIRWCYTARLELPRSIAPLMLAWLHGCSKSQTWILATQLQASLDKPGKKTHTVVVDSDREGAKTEIQAQLESLACAGIDCTACHSFDCQINANGKCLYAHKAILATRCEYFHVFFNLEHFQEAALHSALQGKDQNSSRERLYIGRGDLADQYSHQAWLIAILWMYTDKVVPDVSTQTLLEVLVLADQLICGGLIQKCGVMLRERVDAENALCLLKEAMRLDLDVLSKACCRAIAEHLPDLVEDPQLAALIYDSAASIVEREDVDSVPIIDDIRFYIQQLYPVSQDNAGNWDSEGNVICSSHDQFRLLGPAERRYFLLQNLLDKEGLDA